MLMIVILKEKMRTEVKRFYNTSFIIVTVYSGNVSQILTMIQVIWESSLKMQTHSWVIINPKIK